MRSLPNESITAIGLDMGYGGRDLAVAYVGRYDVRKEVLMLVDHAESDSGMAKMVARIKELHLRWGASVQIASYIGGQEYEVVRLLAEKRVNVIAMPAKVNKYLRSVRTVAAWNDARILVPECPWGDDLVKEASEFTGSEKSEDNRVDALVSLWDFVAENRIKLGTTLAWGRTRI